MVEEGEQGGGEGEGEVVCPQVCDRASRDDERRDAVADQGGEEAVVGGGTRCFYDGPKPGSRDERGSDQCTCTGFLSGGWGICLDGHNYPHPLTTPQN